MELPYFSTPDAHLAISLVESYGCAPNTLQFRNRLGAGHTLIVKCRSNRRISQGANYVSPNSIYSFPVKEKGSNRIVWTCELNDAKSKGMNGDQGTTRNNAFPNRIEEPPELDVVRFANILLNLKCFLSEK
ncbi:hypothetical protein YC2023_014837 [Brassica napus]